MGRLPNIFSYRCGVCGFTDMVDEGMQNHFAVCHESIAFNYDQKQIFVTLAQWIEIKRRKRIPGGG